MDIVHIIAEDSLLYKMEAADLVYFLKLWVGNKHMQKHTKKEKFVQIVNLLLYNNIRVHHVVLKVSHAQSQDINLDLLPKDLEKYSLRS